MKKVLNILSAALLLSLPGAALAEQDQDFRDFNEVSLQPLKVNIPTNLEMLSHPQFYDITSVEIELLEVNEGTMNPLAYLSTMNDCSKASEGLEAPTESPIRAADGSWIEDAKGISGGLDLADVILDKIINMGAKIWNIVKKSRPVVSAKTSYANALPQGVTCWNQMEMWQAPRSEVYRTSYKNLFGFEVIRFEVRTTHAYGGRVNGKGRFITNAAVQYRNLSVAPGMFELNADVEVPNIINVGTRENPVAALQMTLNWTAKGVNHIQRAVNFVVYGDGRPTDVHQ